MYNEEQLIKMGYTDYLYYMELKSGIIRINDEIINYSVPDFMAQVRYVMERKINPVIIYLSSSGGDAYSAFAIYDGINLLRENGIKVEIIVEGLCASAAAMIVLQAADIRKSRKNSRFLIHEAKRWAIFIREKTSEMDDELTEMKAIQDKVIDVLAVRCKKDKQTIKDFIDRKERWMSTEEAKEFGLIDEII